ncbi:hypothetical protein QQ045_016597 [Rhodiola kirilowii]
MSYWLYSHLTMGCGVSTFYCMDDFGFVKPQHPAHGTVSEDDPVQHPDREKIVGEDAFSRQTMASDETGDTCNLGSSSSGCQPKVVCITVHVVNETLEVEKPMEHCVVERSIIDDEEKINEIVEDTTKKLPSKDVHENVNDKKASDSEEEDEPWWKKGNSEFMRSPSFRDYCIIHYSSEDEDDNNIGNEKTHNEKNLRGKENTKAVDFNKKKLRGKVAKRRQREKKILRKEGSGSLRNFLNVAACYSQTHSSKSHP